MTLRIFIEDERRVDTELKQLIVLISDTKALVEAKLRGSDQLEWLEAIKFEPFAPNPHSGNNGTTNLFEFVNQTWTTIATYLGLKYLYSIDKFKTKRYKINLGVRSGPDILSDDLKIEAEVFATTDYTNNGKLRGDIQRLAAKPEIPHRFIFAFVPDKKLKNPEHYKSRNLETEGIVVKAFDMTDLRSEFSLS
ncbi:MAG: hypothetical protein EB088_15680 [Betaproteobacteria bacterium]|nr:hypothetical protein [Betaproteobacteria bacterium]